MKIEEIENQDNDNVNQKNEVVQNIIIKNEEAKEEAKEEDNLSTNNNTQIDNFTKDTTFSSNNNKSVLVLIMKGETRNNNDNIDNMKQLFSNNFFSVKIINIKPKTKFIDNEKLEYALKYSLNSEKWKNKPIIFLKDSSISILSKEEMKIRIEKALNKEADLYFLCKWQDDCDKFKDIKNSYMKWSIQPTAMQAVMFTPHARDYVLELLKIKNVQCSDLINQHIFEEKLTATVFVPNLIDFDINVATSLADYSKLNECKNVKTIKKENNKTEITIWFLVFIILILFSGLLLYSKYF